MDPTSTAVKNKNPAPVQISAEQLLREASGREEAFSKPTEQRFANAQELDEYRHRKRKSFEDGLRMNRSNWSTWISYAKWEETQREFARARQIYERALGHDNRNQMLWMRYAEMEIRNKFINHARNIYDRAVTILPRVDQFWYKFSYMEEMLGNVPGARQIFERWMQWEPEEQAWNLYIKFEKRYNEKEHARQIFGRLVRVHPQPKNWMKWAKFEEEDGKFDNARHVYQSAIDVLGRDHAEPSVFVGFARFETRMKEFERARVIFKYALEVLPRAKADQLAEQFAQFEKQFGQKETIEDVILQKRRLQYEKDLEANPENYDVWFDLIRLEESCVQQSFDSGREKIVSQCRDVYERAIAHVPPIAEKKYWRRYIYLWIYYAVFEELTTKDFNRARQVYLECLNIIPHKIFTFAKVWLLYAQFETRRSDLGASRKALGRAIGMCPKSKLFKGYIELELQLREFDRCRIIYEKFIKYSSINVYAWIKYAELEILLGETERARGIYNLAIMQPVLDMPEVLWKSFIDFEHGEGEVERVRSLYERLLKRTIHPKVWLSYSQFELSIEEGSEASFGSARNILDRGYKELKLRGLQEERRILLQMWMEFEKENFSRNRYTTTPDIYSQLAEKQPQQVKKRRRLNPEDPNDQTMEEYFDYVFPEDEKEEQARKGAGVSKLLAMARQWKQQKSAD